MAIFKALYEHLKTTRKYNTLNVRYKTKCEEYENKVNELKTFQRFRQVEKAKWEELLKEYLDELASTKEELARLKKKKRKESKDEH